MCFSKSTLYPHAARCRRSHSLRPLLRLGSHADAIRDLARTMVARPPAVAIASDRQSSDCSFECRAGRCWSARRHREKVETRRAVHFRRSPPSPRCARSADRCQCALGLCSADRCRSLPLCRVGWRIEQSRLAASRARLSGRVDAMFPPRPHSAIETYAVASSLVKAPHASAECRPIPLQPRSHADHDWKRSFTPVAQDLFRARTGTVIGQEATPVAKFASVQKLEEQLWKGAVWVGEPATS